jgi:hypothetical protein
MAGNIDELPTFTIIVPAEVGMEVGLNSAPLETHIFAPAGKADILPVNIPPVKQRTSVDVSVKVAFVLKLIVIVHPLHCAIVLL